MAQALREIDLSTDNKSDNNRGTIDDELHKSTKDKMQRKKYIGVCSWRLMTIMNIISKFPIKVDDKK